MPAGGSIQSALQSAAAQARAIETSWWVFFWICLVVYVIVLAFAVRALARRREAEDHAPLYARARVWVAGGAVVTAVILLGLLVASIATERSLSAAETAALEIKVAGHRWWWEIEYTGEESFQSVQTANEIHLPAGVPVKIDLTSRDVIHSFWVPSLHGKMDLIPGQTNSIVVTADREGVYRGQCAEFCGVQHAHMGLIVVVESPEAFGEWLVGQRATAAEPATESQMRGREVFLTRQCVVCHKVRGTAAQGRVGPDLTHVASRRTLAAATLPNNRGHLAGWVADPHSVKPGVLMPPTALPSDEFNALIDYLESLR